MSERLLIITIGTRGDIEPYLVLAKAVLARGWTVGVVTYDNFQKSVAEIGAEFFHIEGNIEETLGTPEAKDAVWNQKTIELTKIMMKSQEKYEVNVKLTIKAAEFFKPTMILATIVTIPEGILAGRYLSVPVAIASTVPIVPSGDYAPVTVFATPFRFRAANLAAHAAASKTAWLAFGRRANAVAAELHLPPIDSFSYTLAPVLNIFSERHAAPTDWPAGLWWWGLAGAHDSADAYVPDATLDAFLRAGPPPLYVGFGSMPVPDPQSLVREVVSTTQLGLRAIICGGWSELGGGGFVLPPQVLSITGAPHTWLFPRCCAAVHHGGAGTTAASMRAGIPTIIFPVAADQPFWAHRAAELGVGPTTVVAAKMLCAEVLVQAVRAVQTEEVRARARALGEKLRAEDGVASGVAALELLSRRQGAVLRALPRMQWQDDASTGICRDCAKSFGLLTRRHHCRGCGRVLCGSCLREHRLPT